MTGNSPKNRLDLEMRLCTNGCLVWYCIMVSGERRGIWSPEYHHTLHCIPACMPIWRGRGVGRERNLVRTSRPGRQRERVESRTLARTACVPGGGGAGSASLQLSTGPRRQEICWLVSCLPLQCDPPR